MSEKDVRAMSPAIDQYLRELEDRTRHLPADERAEIISAVEDHIADDLAGVDSPTEADVRQVLDGVGPIDSIVEQSPLPEPPPKSGGMRARVTVLMIGVAALVLTLLPPIGGLVGIAAVIAGLLLRRRDRDTKAWIGAVVLGGIAIVIEIALLSGLLAVWTLSHR